MNDPDPDGPGVLGWAGLVLVTVLGVLSAWLECLFVPVYAGSTPLPVAVLAALVGNAVLPRLGRALVPGTLGAVAPLVGWLAVVIGFGVLTRPEGDIILPGGDLQWVTYAMVLGGALVGTVTVALGPSPVRAPAGSDRRDAS